MAIPVPRDGGIQDLLEEASRSDRRFDAVICESIDRISRRTYIGTLIENTLEEAGVLLFAADEPIVLNGKRASQVLTRRVKQGVAEWYVLELLEKSWGGFEAHTDQGYTPSSLTLCRRRSSCGSITCGSASVWGTRRSPIASTGT
ncbi:recombinase family protein [Actinomadura violacea]|uniref:recombinase family protein n=1 Tax=Actinomadura violacea TaxID=2819934 RepID=UPI003555F2FE